MSTDTLKQLRTLPDLEPPSGSWRQIETRIRLERLQRRGRHALAASVVLVAAGILLSGLRGMDQTPPLAPSAPAFQSMMVAAPANQREPVELDQALLELQARSRNMERFLNSLSRNARMANPGITYADRAGVIAELEDRIATVDYQLNNTVLPAAGPPDSGARRSTLTPVDAPELWRRRVEYMDQLVRAHFDDTGVTGF